MLRNLASLIRYRGLIQSLVARELKARYRGSVLGFFWSFINPLLLLLVYSFVFKNLLAARYEGIDHYELFLFCGILPWTWFSTSLLESAGVLISGGNLIKKVLFPAEVLPIVTVLANMVHFFFGLPILIAFLVYFSAPITAMDLLWFPVVVIVQAIFTLGWALILSALTVHFRDIRDILGHVLTIWFFSTPVIYPYTLMTKHWQQGLLNLNPMSHVIITYQEILYFPGSVGHWIWLIAVGAASLLFFLFGYWVFDRLRDTFAEDTRFGGMNAITVTNASKVYRRYSQRRQFTTLKSALLSRSLTRDLTPAETFAAVRDVTVSVPRGRTLGVIGRNGSGKSTLLKLVAGITKPTTGTVHVNGRISALIELGAGFHPEISGRENVFINGIMLGLTKREIARRFDEIVDFAEMKDFIDAPVKTYSSGMYMRLGFAVAIHVDPDVLLVDEVLAVGDEGFTHKCLDKFAEFKRRGKTILLVTHSLGLVERFCDDALWMDAGSMKALGDPKRVVGAYITDVETSEEEQLAAGDARARESVQVITPDEPASAVLPDNPIETAEGPADMFRATEGRWGSREIEITDVQLCGADGDPGHVFHSGEALTIRIGLRSPIENDDFVIGIGIFNAEGVCCYGTNTSIEDLKAVRIFGDAEARFTIESLDLVEGTYKLDVAIHKLDGYPYDYHRLLYTFRVKSRTKDVGIYRPRHAWHFSDSLAFDRAEHEA